MKNKQIKNKEFLRILETLKKFVTPVLCLLFIGCVYLIIIGQKNIGYTGLGTMLIGLAGILAIIFVYNRKYK